MSNMIKSYFVRYDEELKKTIDKNTMPQKEILPKKLLVNSSEQEEGAFTQGLQAVIVEKLPSKEEEEKISSKIIEDAQKKAEQILEQANQEAERIKKETLAKAQKQGYEEGLKQGSRQVQNVSAELEARAKQMQLEYDTSVAELEPKMVEIIASLLERLTGILVEDKEEVIGYLVTRALKNMDNCSEYTIRVAKDNYEYLQERKNLLLDVVGSEVSLMITEDANLLQNQCLIETDLRIIDCSLDVQLSNLITDLKLLGKI